MGAAADWDGALDLYITPLVDFFRVLFMRKDAAENSL
jgi:hypothetical protein